MVTFREVSQADSRCPSGSSGEKRQEDSSSQIPLVLLSAPAQMAQRIFCAAREESVRRDFPQAQDLALQFPPTHLSLLGPFMAALSNKAEPFQS